MPSDVIKCPKGIEIDRGRQKEKRQEHSNRGENAKEKRTKREKEGTGGTELCRAERAEAPCFSHGHLIFLERLPAGWRWYPVSMRL